MSIYGYSYQFSSENKRWKADLKNKTLICEDKKYIESSMYDIRHDLIVIDGINSDTSRKKCNEICFEIIENLYHKYKYSIPSERSEKYRQREYFRALKPDEMTDEQLVTGEDRNYARAALEAFILCASWQDIDLGRRADGQSLVLSGRIKINYTEEVDQMLGGTKND